jgi:hypothetical protein
MLAAGRSGAGWLDERIGTNDWNHQLIIPLVGFERDADAVMLKMQRFC